MNQDESDHRIVQMIKFIKQEADEKAQQILDGAKQKMLKDKNRLYNEQREQLVNKYKKKEEQLVV